MHDQSFADPQVADLTIKVNSLCNAACAHCFQYSRTRRRELDLGALADALPYIFDALADLGVRCVMLSIVGGEPSLLSQEARDRLSVSVLPAIVRAAQGTPVDTKVTFISNLLIGPAPVQWIANLSRHAQSLGLHMQIATSYESDTGRFDGEGTAARWRENVRYLRTHERLSVQVTLTRGVCRTIEDVIAELSPEFDSLDFQPLVLLPEAMPDASIVPGYSELAHALTVIQRGISRGLPINLPLAVRKPGYYLAVDEDGSLSTAFSEEVHCNRNRVSIEHPELGHWVRRELRAQLRNRIRRRVLYAPCRSCSASHRCSFGLEKLLSVYEPQGCHGFPQVLQASL